MFERSPHRLIWKMTWMKSVSKKLHRQTASDFESVEPGVLMTQIPNCSI